MSRDSRRYADIWTDDLMGRHESALFLYTYLIKNPGVRILNINSAWGTGKTFFLERWQRTLQRDHVCITFNAWKNDSAIEPLIALASAIKNQLGGSGSQVSPAMHDFLHQTASAVRSASPVVAHGMLSRLGSVAAETLGNDPRDGTRRNEQALEQLLLSQQPVEYDIALFRTALQAMLDEHRKQHPEMLDDVFIIIDELDHCRPVFAIGLLERIRHFFDLEGCRFIIASDSEQLEHSVRSIYGTGFDASTFMRRFFDLNFSLPDPDYATFIAHNLPELGEGLGYLGLDHSVMRPEVMFLEAMAVAFDISLRDLERCLQRIAACHASLPLECLPVTSALIFCLETRPGDFRKLGPHGLAEHYETIGITNASYSDPSIMATPMDAFVQFIEYMDMSQADLLDAIKQPESDPLTRAIQLLIASDREQLRNCQKAVEMATHIH